MMMMMVIFCDTPPGITHQSARMHSTVEEGESIKRFKKKKEKVKRFTLKHGRISGAVTRVGTAWSVSRGEKNSNGWAALCKMGRCYYTHSGPSPFLCCTSEGPCFPSISHLEPAEKVNKRKSPFVMLHGTFCKGSSEEKGWRELIR